MTHETKKAVKRRLLDSRFTDRYFVGDGIDIGSGDDSLANYAMEFSGISSVRSWDMEDGDAVQMATVANNSFDFINSSHCLEHLTGPVTAMINWIRICKPGGYLTIVVPDERLYEQGFWPSRFNPDHKWSFRVGKTSERISSMSVLDMLSMFKNDIEILKVELLDEYYDYNMHTYDQSLLPDVEPAIEFVLRKF